MREHGRFLVKGPRRYRGHEVGDKFEAKLDPALHRAMSLGAIQLLELVTPALQPGSYRLPDDWPPTVADTKQTGGAERGASLIR